MDKTLTIESVSQNPKFFKTELVRKRFRKMHPALQEIAITAMCYAIGCGVEQPVLTETATTEAEDKALKRVSRTHSQCRAFDMRVNDWSGEQIDAMLVFLTKAYNHVGALQADGNRCVALCHDSGHGMHFHVQLDTTYALKLD